MTTKRFELDEMTPEDANQLVDYQFTIKGELHQGTCTLGKLPQRLTALYFIAGDEPRRQEMQRTLTVKTVMPSIGSWPN